MAKKIKLDKSDRQQRGTSALTVKGIVIAAAVGLVPILWALYGFAQTQISHTEKSEAVVYSIDEGQSENDKCVADIYYKVGEETYYGDTSCFGIERDDRIAVYYDPDDPESISRGFRLWLVLVGLGWSLVALAGGFGVREWELRRSASN